MDRLMTGRIGLPLARICHSRSSAASSMRCRRFGQQQREPLVFGYPTGGTDVGGIELGTDRRLATTRNTKDSGGGNGCRFGIVLFGHEHSPKEKGALKAPVSYGD